MASHRVEIKREVRAELTEGEERVQTQTEFVGDSKERIVSVVFALGVWGFNDSCGQVHVSSLESRNCSVKDECSGVLHMSLMPWSQKSWSQGA